jgi:putative membrane protein
MKSSKLIILLFVVIAVTWSVESCNNNSQNNSQDSVDSAKEANDTSAMVMVDEIDSRFAVKAADGGMAEVEMAKTAEQKAMNARVKSFASMIVADHTKANEELKSTAVAKNITLPSMIGEDHQEHITKLSQKNGRDFDKEFMNMMVDGHQKTIDLFEKEASDGKDADLKTWATNTLPTLRQHLDSAKAIRDIIKK